MIVSRIIWSVALVFAVGGAAWADEGRELERAKIHTELSMQYFIRGQYGVALDEANIAIKAKRNFAPAYNALALINAELREDEEAVRAFRKGLSYQSADSDLNHNYGWFLCERGKAKDSLPYFRTALRNPLYETPEKALVSAGVCAMRSGDFDAATIFFDKALKLKPDYPPALWNLANESFKLGKPGDARRYLLQLNRTVEPNAAALWLGVRIERRLGDKEAETAYAEKLKKQFPESKEVAEMLNGQP